MADYVLEGSKWGAGTTGTPGGTVTWAVDGSVPAFFVGELSAALNDWARWADIGFRKVDATDAAQITVSLGDIDGPGNVVGEAYEPGVTERPTILFDVREGWHEANGAVVADAGYPFFPIALHEIGHALGLDHYNDAPAIMNAMGSLAITDLEASDIDGIQALYGTGGGALFGVTVHDTADDPGQVYALYDAILGRAADPLGLEGYLRDMASGQSLEAVANSLIGSTEGRAHLSASDDAGFVGQLYAGALHRQADAAGLQHYLDALGGGASRASVAIDIALSTESQADLAGALGPGIFAPDATGSDLARLYHAVLGRAPDAVGLTHYAELADGGTALGDVAASLLSSPEYRSGHGAPDDAAFVEGLYGAALGRAADPGGLQGYLGMLAGGAGRGAVAVSIAESEEARLHLLPAVELGHDVA